MHGTRHTAHGTRKNRGLPTRVSRTALKGFNLHSLASPDGIWSISKLDAFVKSRVHPSIPRSVALAALARRRQGERFEVILSALFRHSGESRTCPSYKTLAGGSESGTGTGIQFIHRFMKVPIFVLTRINPLTPTLSPNPGGEGRVRGRDPSILFRDD